MQDFTTGFTVEQDAADAVAAISDVRGWWTGEIEGRADAVGDTFTYAFRDLHRSVHRVTTHSLDRVEWTTLEGGPRFTGTPDEWAGTVIRFELEPSVGGGTDVRFTHVGLSPELSCFEACSPAWAAFVQALERFIATGERNAAPPVGA